MRVRVCKGVEFVNNVLVVTCHLFAYNPYNGYICAINVLSSDMF